MFEGVLVVEHSKRLWLGKKNDKQNGILECL